MAEMGRETFYLRYAFPAAQKRKRPSLSAKPLILLVLLTGIELVTY